MAEDPPEPLVAYDHTDLLTRPKRIWNWGNIPLPGLLLPALGASFVSGIAWVVLLTAVSSVVPFLGLSLLTSLLYFGPPVAVYFVWGRPLSSTLTLSQELVVRADYWLQPKRLQGLGADREPEELHWQVILWTPGSPRWHRRYAAAREAAAQQGTSFSTGTAGRAPGPLSDPPPQS
ncbi:hypothetical protein IHE55_15625 [Streptomyces pactum]|uniref:DUF304 domain-containing protein n=1 Tax=Streptomyces pactum TaxID=68249 RepID=A0ABS0NLU7_9ACTN|nr:hypothetical protein [Streptomyces pactum]MBH5336136.1 hypothetical protein [Streptomyces pactum]